MPKILNGRELRDKIAEDLKKSVAQLSFKPKMVVIKIGDNAESDSYIRQKELFGKNIGVDVEVVRLDAGIMQVDVLKRIDAINNDKNIQSVIVQLPIPENLYVPEIFDSILPEKDIDGLSVWNQKKNYSAEGGGIVPATARGVISLLEKNNIEIAGKLAVVVGRSKLVGRPVAMELLKRNATVVVCHSKTQNLAEETKRADILVVATGKPKLITKDFVKKGAVVIDVGTTYQGVGETSKITGDVDFESVKDIVGAISPVPGGVGPMTVVSLFQNLVESCEPIAE